MTSAAPKGDLPRRTAIQTGENRRFATTCAQMRARKQVGAAVKKAPPPSLAGRFGSPVWTRTCNPSVTRSKLAPARESLARHGASPLSPRR